MENLCPFINEDAEVLANFLLKQVFPTDEFRGRRRTMKILMLQRTSPLKEAIARAFGEKRLSLKGLSVLLSSKWMGLAINCNGKLFTCLKTLLEGDFFCDAFANIFQEVFITKYEDFRNATPLIDFFGDYMPLSTIDLAYGFGVFKIFETRKLFPNMGAGKLLKFAEYVDSLLTKRNIIQYTSLFFVPSKDKDKEEKEQEVKMFFKRMAKKLEFVKSELESL